MCIRFLNALPIALCGILGFSSLAMAQDRVIIRNQDSGAASVRMVLRSTEDRTLRIFISEDQGTVLYTIDGGDPIALVDLSVLSINHLIIITGNGNDTINIDDLVTDGSVLVRTIRGSDSVTLSGVDIGGGLTVLTHSQNDDVTISSSLINGSTTVGVGRQTDEITVNNSTFTGPVQLNGGLGNNDTVFDDGTNSFMAAVNMNGVEVIDAVEEEDDTVLDDGTPPVLGNLYAEIWCEGNLEGPLFTSQEAASASSYFTDIPGLISPRSIVGLPHDELDAALEQYELDIIAFFEEASLSNAISYELFDPINFPFPPNLLLIDGVFISTTFSNQPDWNGPILVTFADGTSGIYNTSFREEQSNC